ncbi:MAG: phosphoribosylglycinamide formyltransferase [Ideonella sp. MAG2]|nr:MAG: phosphoribosylglycinamide formyltransferase [Ideonella sp. MAG2]
MQSTGGAHARENAFAHERLCGASGLWILPREVRFRSSSACGLGHRTLTALQVFVATVVNKRIVILISGRGSNMQAIVERCAQEGWAADVVAVISNKPEASGLAWAAQQGIATAALNHKAFANREAFDAELAQEIDRHAPDVVVLAGFMRILTPSFVQHYQGRLLNIHPSLLPAFPGLHTHRKAIEAGCRVAGATVHFVTADLDHGPIVSQVVVPVSTTDDEDSLAARILVGEHRIYPQAVRWCVEGRLRIEGCRVHQLDGEAQCLML